MNCRQKERKEGIDPHVGNGPIIKSDDERELVREEAINMARGD